MPELIVHEYGASPFSEKIRRILAFKGLAWRALRVPAVMPKPDVVALTGGYRRTPLLQIENHVYCDTALIARVLEGLSPEPTLYPHLGAEILAEWADTSLFETAAALSIRPTRFDRVMELLTPEELSKFRDDRQAMSQGARRAWPSYAASRAHFPVYTARLEADLVNNAYVAGERPSIADFSVYHCLWFLEMLAPELLAGLPRLEAWRARIAAMGRVECSPITSEEALAVCRLAQRSEDTTESTPDPNGLEIGARVVVRTTDYARDPVEGELVRSRLNEVVIARTDDRAGLVFVHFPRVGYEVRPVAP